jgi:ubiquinone/menaquinone biosynthesis C-methylase UbiE
MFKTLFQDDHANLYESILDVGSTSDVSLSSNAFLKFLRARRITSVSDQEITSQTVNKFPHVNFMLGDALDLKFASGSFDMVFSNAVLEHVGSIENVSRFISECERIGTKKVILITPNRWFPLETHTKIFFLHWLPKRIFRRLLSKIGMGFFAREENLNLLSLKELKKIVLELNLEGVEFKYIKFFGIPSNIVLSIHK